MIAEATRRSALADYAERFTKLYETTGGSISIRELPFVAQLNLRVDPGHAAVVRRVTDSLGFGLPLTPNTVAFMEECRALWLGPDEWFVVGPADQAASLEQALRNGLAEALGSIVDVSANRTVLEIRGAEARDLLAHGVPIDLDPRSFGANRCAQTLLAKAQVIIEQREEEAAFFVYVRSSFACYVADWLLDAAADPSSHRSSGKQGPSRVMS